MIKLLILGLSYQILAVIWKNLGKLWVFQIRVAYYESTTYEISSKHTKIHFQIFAKRMWCIN